MARRDQGELGVRSLWVYQSRWEGLEINSVTKCALCRSEPIPACPDPSAPRSPSFTQESDEEL